MLKKESKNDYYGQNMQILVFIPKIHIFVNFQISIVWLYIPFLWVGREWWLGWGESGSFSHGSGATARLSLGCSLRFWPICIFICLYGECRPYLGLHISWHEMITLKGYHQEIKCSLWHGPGKSFLVISLRWTFTVFLIDGHRF